MSPEGDRSVALGDDPFSTVELTLDETASIADDRPEPLLAATPILIEFDEPVRLDPARIGLTWEVSPPPRPSMRLRSPLASLALHVLPVLAMIVWISTRLMTPPAIIPVQLVLEEPPPPPPVAEPPPPQQQPAQGPRASEDMGDVKPKELGTTTSPAPPAAGEQQTSSTATQTAAAAPAPPPVPPPKPAPPKEAAPVHPPKPSGAAVPHHEETPHEAPRAAHFAGPAATRDEYLAYLVALTRQHLDLLPMSLVGTRRGETVISVVVEDSGAISRIAVAHSSGYPDIDKRIADMVAAVRKFPPLPQWYQGNAVQLELTLRFPDALERSR